MLYSKIRKKLYFVEVTAQFILCLLVFYEKELIFFCFTPDSDNINFIKVDVNPFNLHSASGTISSPFFPIQYPGDFRSQYKIQCSVTTREKCRIRLIFTDHRLMDQSVLEVSKLFQFSTST